MRGPGASKRGARRMGPRELGAHVQLSRTFCIRPKPKLSPATLASPRGSWNTPHPEEHRPAQNRDGVCSVTRGLV